LVFPQGANAISARAVAAAAQMQAQATAARTPPESPLAESRTTGI
jgi:hypothetical protein